MVNKIMFMLASIVVFFSVVVVFGIANGMGCNYEIQPFKTNESTTTVMTCYRGKVVALHYGNNLNSNNAEAGDKSLWKVEGQQLNYGNQVIFFIYNRYKLEGNDLNNESDRYNLLASGYKLLFYNFDIVGDNLYIVETFPKDNFYVTKLSGTVSNLN